MKKKFQKIKISESLKNMNYSLNEAKNGLKTSNFKQRDKILSIIRGGTDISKKNLERNFISQNKNSSFSSKKKKIHGSKSLRDIDYSFNAISGMFKKKTKGFKDGKSIKRKFRGSKEK